MTERETRTPFGQRMLKARKAAGLTQTQARLRIAQDGGEKIAQSTISDAESIAIGSKHVTRFAELYGVDADWLATGAGTMTASSGRPAKWPFDRISAKQWQALTERARGVVEHAAVEMLDRLEGGGGGGGGGALSPPPTPLPPTSKRAQRLAQMFDALDVERQDLLYAYANSLSNPELHPDAEPRPAPIPAAPPLPAPTPKPPNRR